MIKVSIIHKTALGCLNVSPCLIKCQGQSSKFLRDFFSNSNVSGRGLPQGSIWSNYPGTTKEQERSFLDIHLIHLNFVGQLSQCLYTCSQQQVSSWSRGNKIADNLQVLSIVKNQ